MQRIELRRACLVQGISTKMQTEMGQENKGDYWGEPTPGRVVLLVWTHSDFVQTSHLLQAVLMDLGCHQSPLAHYHQKPILHYYSLVLLHTIISTMHIRGTPCSTSICEWALLSLPSFPFGNLLAPALPVCCACWPAPNPFGIPLTG